MRRKQRTGKPNKDKTERILTARRPRITLYLRVALGYAIQKRFPKPICARFLSFTIQGSPLCPHPLICSFPQP